MEKMDMSLHKVEPLSKKLRSHQIRPITNLEWRGGNAYPYVINVYEFPDDIFSDSQWLDVYDYCYTEISGDFILRRTAWHTINVFLQSLDDAEQFADQFESDIKYIKGPVNQFHIDILKDQVNKMWHEKTLYLEDKLGPYYGKYDAKIELYSWPFMWQDEAKADQIVEFIRENLDIYKFVDYTWGTTVYLNHKDYVSIQPFLMLSIGEIGEYRKALRLYVRILEDK